MTHFVRYYLSLEIPIFSSVIQQLLSKDLTKHLVHRPSVSWEDSKVQGQGYHNTRHRNMFFVIQLQQYSHTHPHLASTRASSVHIELKQLSDGASSFSTYVLHHFFNLLSFPFFMQVGEAILNFHFISFNFSSDFRGQQTRIEPGLVEAIVSHYFSHFSVDKTTAV